MGLWDKVKSAALSAKCMTGWHAGEYKRVPDTPDCFFTKQCPDCGKEVETNRHKYGDIRYKYALKCDAVRNCIYCEHEAAEIAHNYEDLGLDRNCQEMKKCNRCGDLKIGRPQHSYRTTGKDSSCREIQECSRCRHVNHGRSHHNWISLLGHEVKVSGKRKCRDCGATE